MPVGSHTPFTVAPERFFPYRWLEFDLYDERVAEVPRVDRRVDLRRPLDTECRLGQGAVQVLLHLRDRVLEAGKLEVDVDPNHRALLIARALARAVWLSTLVRLNGRDAPGSGEAGSYRPFAAL